MPKVLTLATIVAACLLSVSSSSANAPFFMGLGDLPGGSFASRAAAVSADGSVVVGTGTNGTPLGSEAFRWENGVMVGLGDLPGGNFVSAAHDVSADGSVVVGTGRGEPIYPGGPQPTEAFRWENGTMTGLGDLPGGGFGSYGSGVSGNGLVVVGTGSVDSLTAAEAFRWKDGVMTGLGFLPGGMNDSSVASAESFDGSVVVGGSTSLLGDEAFRWENGVMTGLGDLPGGVYSSSARAVSDDGLVIVGLGASSSGYEACRWINGQPVGLGDLPGGIFSSEASGISGNGRVVVGRGRSDFGAEACVWIDDQGIRSVRDLLEQDYGLDLTGWTLMDAMDASYDGTTLVGSGINPDGNEEAWIAHIPEPAMLSVLLLAGLVSRRWR